MDETDDSEKDLPMTELPLPSDQAAPPPAEKAPRIRKSTGPICEKRYCVVNQAGEQAITSDDIFECLATLKKMGPGAKLQRQDGILLSFTSKPKIQPEARRLPIVFKKREETEE